MNKTELSAERTERLDAIGFSLDPFTQQWEEGFAALVRFEKREGHCLVKRSHEDDGGPDHNNVRSHSCKPRQ